MLVTHYKDAQKYIVSGNKQAFPSDIKYMKITNFMFSALEKIVVF